MKSVLKVPKRGRFVEETNAKYLKTKAIPDRIAKLRYKEVTDHSLSSSTNELYPYKTLKDSGGNIKAPGVFHLVDNGFGKGMLGINKFQTNILNQVWNTKPSLIHGRYAGFATGTSSNTIIAGGTTSTGASISGSVYSKISNKYNGSSWSQGPSTVTGRSYAAMSGPANSSFIAGGNATQSAYVYNSEKYNGTTFSSSNSININRAVGTSSRNSNAGVLCGGQNDTDVPSGQISNILNSVELYNGSTWSSSASLNINRSACAACGVVNDTIVCKGLLKVTASSSGLSTTFTKTTEVYNSYIWSMFIDTLTDTFTYTNNAEGTGKNAVCDTDSLFNGTVWKYHNTPSIGLADNEWYGGVQLSGNANSNIMLLGGQIVRGSEISTSILVQKYTCVLQNIISDMSKNLFRSETNFDDAIEPTNT